MGSVASTQAIGSQRHSSILRPSARSQVVAFNDQRRKVLTTLPFRLGGLSALPSPDTPALGITIVGEGKDRAPVPYFQLLWMSGIREDAGTVGDLP